MCSRLPYGPRGNSFCLFQLESQTYTVNNYTMFAYTLHFVILGCSKKITVFLVVYIYIYNKSLTITAQSSRLQCLHGQVLMKTLF